MSSSVEAFAQRYAAAVREQDVETLNGLIADGEVFFVGTDPDERWDSREKVLEIYRAQSEVLGDDFGQQMQALFARDLQVSQRIDAEQWAKRGLGQRLLQGFARLVEPLL